MAHLFTALTSYEIFDKAAVRDELIDTLHYRATSAILVVFALGVSFKQFGGRPIECALSQIADGADEAVSFISCIHDAMQCSWKMY